MVRPSTAARRYAEAAFELATRDDAVDAWRDGLALAAEVAADDRVVRIVDNPAAPLADRLAFVGRLIEGRVSAPVERLVKLLAQRGRIEMLPAVAADYNRLLNRRREIVEALVTSASPLTADQTTAVRDHVATMTGRRVDLRSSVDPDLIGGLTVRVGDRLVDASVRGRLQRLRDQLVAGTR